jgi:hypothetical protein
VSVCLLVPPGRESVVRVTANIVWYISAIVLIYALCKEEGCKKDERESGVYVQKVRSRIVKKSQLCLTLLGTKKL